MTRATPLARWRANVAAPVSALEKALGEAVSLARSAGTGVLLAGEHDLRTFRQGKRPSLRGATRSRRSRVGRLRVVAGEAPDQSPGRVHLLTPIHDGVHMKPPDADPRVPGTYRCTALVAHRDGGSG